MNHNEIPEKPILMSGPMVLSILADLKTQTRMQGRVYYSATRVIGGVNQKHYQCFK